ncbi:M1 family aminopeptidase [Paucibacter sp. R3-3]|uniref:M1 family aminopeptidase n=1 Tax=Roseateles agri TaxID=3098619 RepID=A0ABU5DFL2_9BURK|nr:M1 family aminopeptidase [Paucibacter sp. R3-3]MDY0745078.1 M1 family aminopeptidase [Paucibacter sp. R3-3]
MLSKIAAFELRYQLRSPLFVVSFILFFLLAFGATTLDQIQIGARGNVNINAPYAILQTLGIMNVFAVFVVTAFVANVVIRDDETGFAPILRATRVGKFDYLIGRFVGATTVAFLVTAAVPLAILVGSWMPWLDAEKIGPLHITHYVYALFLYGLPTLLVMSAGFFALATATRSMMWSYIGAVAFLVLFVATRIMLRDPVHDTISGLSDPFALSTLNRITRYWTASDRNTLLPPLEGVLLWNRLLWLGIAFALLALAYRLFRFETRGVAVSKQAKNKKAAADPAPTPRPLAAPSSPAAARWPQFRALAGFDMRFVFKSPAFFVLLVIGVFNAFGALTDTTELRGVNYLPVTRAIIDALQGSFTFIPTIIAVYYAGELVWRDRERRIHEIVDASAAPNWAHLLPKVLAIAGVLLATLLVAVATGMLWQLAHGYTRLDPAAYALWFVLPNLITALLLAVLAVFAQALVPHKFIGWALMLVYVVAGITLSMLGFEHKLYNYADTAAVPLSDMNRMGRFWIGRAWHQAYWLAFAAMLLVGTQLLWRRGAETRLRPRLALVGTRLRGPAGLALGIAALAWVGTGAWIWHNTNQLNRYVTQPEAEQLAADVEKTLLPFENLPQPTITDVRLDVQLYPQRTRAEVNGSYRIENRTGQPLARVDIEQNPKLTDVTLKLDGASLQQDWPLFGHRIYKLEPPMQPGEQRTLQFAAVLEERGFVNGTPQTRILPNGSFLDNFEVTPQFGVSRRGLLDDRSKRRKHGLPAELRPAKLEDTAATAHHYLRDDSAWVNAEIHLTTDADQTPIAPGTKLSDTTTDGRRTLVTRTEAPILNFFSLQSARYAEKHDSWHGADGKPVDLAVYYEPAHDANAPRMLAAMKASLSLFSEQFSPFQFNQLRILEFPAYANFAQSFAGTVPYSEGIGFIQNFDDKQQDSKIDLVTYVTAHEVAHQWWAHQIIGADKQGATMLSETFAQYSALLVMEKLYGREQLRKFAKYELDSYLRSRGGELIEELPLDRVENQPYIHYRKGALVMYWLKEAVGEEVVNRALRKLLAEYAFKPAPFPSSTDFLRLLRAEATPAQQQLITDLFEKITLYDMKALDAKATKRADGRYDVSFTIEARKLYADGRGKETEAPLDEAFDIGVFSAEPGKAGYTRDAVLLLERRALHGGRQQISVVVDKPPAFVGVDPFNLRIDRNSDDNLARVE